MGARVALRNVWSVSILGKKKQKAKTALSHPHSEAPAIRTRNLQLVQVIVCVLVTSRSEFVFQRNRVSGLKNRSSAKLKNRVFELNEETATRQPRGKKRVKAVVEVRPARVRPSPAYMSVFWTGAFRKTGLRKRALVANRFL